MPYYIRQYFGLFVLLISTFISQAAIAADGISNPIRTQAGSTVQLDPTDGLDLTAAVSTRAQWSWVERPATSVSDFSDAYVLRPTVMIDVPGSYLARLDLFPADDVNATVPLASTTLNISTDNVAPVAKIQGRGLPGSIELTLDATQSYDVDGDALTYSWSTVSAPTSGSITFSDVDAVFTDVSLDGAGVFEIGLTVQDSTGLTSETAIFEIQTTASTGLDGDYDLQGSLQTFNLISEMFSGNQEVEGRTFIGSTVTNTNGQFGFAPSNDAASLAELYIDGDLVNSNINLTPGDEARITGSRVNSNVNNGVLVENVTDLPVIDFQLYRDQSAFLSSLTGAAADLSDQNNKRFGGSPNVVASEAVFGANTRIVTASMQDLQSGGYSIDLSQADTVIINVSGTSGSFQMNPLGGTGYAENVIWNFFEATSISVNSVIVGHVLAPYATMTGFAGSSEGTVIAKEVLLTNGELHQRDWLGQVPAPIEAGSGEITRRNVSPVASARFAQLETSVDEPLLIEPFGSTDIDGQTLTPEAFVAFAPEGATTILNLQESGAASFAADTVGEYLVGYRVTDGAFEAVDFVLISVGAANQRPVARIADILSAPLNATVELDGTQSFDFDGDLLNYNWSLISAPANSSLSLEAQTPVAAIVPDAVGTYVVQLTASDGQSSSVPATLAITVDAPHPIANAGRDRFAGDFGLLPLDGSLSSGLGQLTYQWSFLDLSRDGLSGVIEGANLVMPNLRLDVGEARFRDVIRQTYVYHLKRPDNGGLCQFDTRLPADLSGTSASEQISITLHSRGRKNGPNGNILVWEIENKNNHTREILLRTGDGTEHGTFVVPGRVSVHVTTSDIGKNRMYAVVDGTAQDNDRAKKNSFNRNNPVCTGPGAGVVQLVVADDALISLPDTIFIGNGNLRPVLASSPTFEVDSGDSIALDAALYSTDANGDSLTFSWSLIYRPELSAATITGDPVVVKAVGATLDFSPDLPGTYLVQLEASDGTFIAEPVVFAIQTKNTGPTAVASDLLDTFVNETVVLDGSASFDPDGDALSYSWSLVGSPANSVAEIASSQTPIASFVPDLRGEYTFELLVSDGDLSDVASVVLTAPNRSPVANLVGPIAISATSASLYSAAGSSDPDGDELSFTFSVSDAPSSAEFELIELGNGDAQLIATTEGSYTLDVVVSDGLETTTTTLDVTVSSGTNNRAPILGALNGPYNVELGLEFKLVLTGQDPDGDPLVFFADPLPLPTGISLNSATGRITFRPELGQEGQYSFTVGVSDGSLTDTATLNINVLEGTAGQTALTGRVLDAVDFANGVVTPLVGIPVRLQNSALQAVTQADGTFTFSSLSAGNEQVFVEPSANGGPGGYNADTRVITVTDNQVRDLSPDFLLVPLGDGCATVVPGTETLLSSSVSGVSVTIAADTVQDGSGSAYEGQICLGSLPRLFERAGFPRETNACQIYALDAPGAIFTGGISVRGPNVDLLPQQTTLELWQLNGSNGLFRPAAEAVVDGGGTTVSAVAERFTAGSLFTFLPQAPFVAASADMNNGNNRDLTPFEGNLGETYTLPGYRSFNRMQEISLAYNSVTADPTIIVAGDVTIPETASLPETVQTRIELSGLSIEDSVSWTPRIAANGEDPALIGEELRLRQSMPFDATGLSDGRYDYTYYTSATYACSTVASSYRGEVYVQNKSESPYGKGWGIDELQKLVQRPDGKVAIIDDDSVEVFDPEPTFTEFDEAARLTFPAVGPQGISTADLDGDGDLDVLFGNSGDGTVRTLTNLGGREFTTGSIIKVEEGNDVPPTGIYFPNIQGALPIDLNGDRLPDIAYTAQISDTLAYLENQGLGAFDKQVAITNFGQMTSIAIDDVDGDGFQDTIFSRFAGFFGAGNAEIYVDFGGDGQRVRLRVALQPFGDTGLQIETADLNGDGLRDIIYRLEDGLELIINNGNRDFDLISDDLGGEGTDLLGKYFGAADLNQDGRDDLVTTHAASGIQIFLSDPESLFFDPVIIPFPANATSRPYTFLLDIEGDDIQDLVLSYATISGVEVSVYKGIGDGTFEPPETGLLDYTIAEQIASDVDGDGSLDLVSLQRFSVTIDFSKPSAGGSLIAGKGEFSTLTQLPNGDWERRYKDGNKVIFNAEGLQTAEVDTQGNRREFDYGDNGELTSITDQVGGITTLEYDGRGRLTTVTYPDGRTTSMEYQDVELVGVTEPDGDQVSFAYDDFGRLSSTINQNGNETLYTHDDTGKMNGATLPDGSSIRNQVASSLGLVDGLGGAVGNPRPYVAPEDRKTTVTDRKGEVSEVIVNSFGSTVQVTDPLGRVTRMERNFNDLVERLERPSDGTVSGVRVDLLSYDGRANITQMIEAFGTPEQRVMSYVYEPEFNKVTQMADGDGFVTSYAYDNFGEVVQIADPEGGTQSRTYAGNGKLTRQVDERGNLTQFEYLANQNLGSITYADGSVTQMEYDPQGNSTRVTEAAGTDSARTVVRTFDSDNRVTSVDVISAAGVNLATASFATAPVIEGVTSYAYDGVGNLTQMVDETGLTTTMSYDDLERLVALDDPAEGTIQRNYNLAGELTEHTNGDGAVHSYAYDAVSRLTETTDAENYVKSFEYDLRDNISRVVDGRGGATVFAYDGLDRMTRRTNPLSQVMQRAYDRRDNLISMIREDGLTETASYDGKGRRTEVITPDNTLRFGFDPRDNLILAEDDDSRVTLTYDERNRLISTATDGSISVQPTVTMTYTYDELDRRTTMSDSFGGTTTYGYDAEDRLTSLATPWGVEYAMSYDEFGRRTGLSSTSGRVSSMSYNNGLLTALTHVQNGVTLTDLVYRYDVDAQLIGIDDQLDPSRSKGINYDDLNRLVQVSEGIPVLDGGTQLPVEDYAYDEEGNRLASHLSSLYMSDAHNRLLEDDDSTYDYDEKGNRIRKTAKADGSIEGYAYDSQNRLTQYTDAQGTATQYLYDAMERRIAKVQGDTAMAYIYDTSITDPLAFDDILLEFTVVGSDTGGGGGGNPTFAACNAQFEQAGIQTSELFGFDLLPPSLTDELVDQFGGPDAILTVDLLDAGGVSGFLLLEVLDFLFQGDAPFACTSLANTGGGGGPDFPDLFSASVASFASDDAESVTLNRRWAHSNKVDEPLGFEEYSVNSGAGSGIERLVFSDRQGSVLTIADTASETILAKYEYDSFGHQTQSIGTLRQPYGYAGREFDTESGLYHYRARSYDPLYGVFLQSDPIGFYGGTLNIHQSFSSDPFNASDPTGLVVKADMHMTALVSGVTLGVIGHTINGTLSLSVKTQNALGNVGNIVFSNGDPADYPGYGNAGHRDPHGNKCAAAIARVKLAKENPNRRTCMKPGKAPKSRAEASLRAAAWTELGMARAQRDAVCTNGPKGTATYAGEQDAHASAWMHSGACLALTMVLP